MAETETLGLRELARLELGDSPDLSEMLDEAAVNAGWNQRRMIDPGRWCSDLLKRMLGEERAPRDDYCELPLSPPSWFKREGVLPAAHGSYA